MTERGPILTKGAKQYERRQYPLTAVAAMLSAVAMSTGCSADMTHDQAPARPRVTIDHPTDAIKCERTPPNELVLDCMASRVGRYSLYLDSSEGGKLIVSHTVQVVGDRFNLIPNSTVAPHCTEGYVTFESDERTPEVVYTFDVCAFPSK
jgi:hypothetical protein